MLKLGGCINLLIALAHLVGLCWANWMFAVTGIDKEMTALATIHYSLPYLLTVLVAIVFAVFGMYGLLANNKRIRLPFQKTVIFFIAGIYIFRGLGKLIFDMLTNANTMLEVVYSSVALAIGLIYLFGGMQKKKDGYDRTVKYSLLK